MHIKHLALALVAATAIGGANAVVPEIHRLSVHAQHWMTDTQFVDLFALAQAAPGPIPRGA